MFQSVALLSFALLATTGFGQQVGTNTAESHPKLTWAKCTSAGCTQQNGEQLPRLNLNSERVLIRT